MNELIGSDELASTAPATRSPHPRHGGRYLYALGAAMLACIWLASGDFINVWQPVAEHFPARSVLVYVSAAAMLISAVGLFLPRTARIAAVVPTLLYLLFAWGWITRIMLLPRVFGTWSGCAEELVLVIAGVLLLTTSSVTGFPPPRVVAVSRVAFGLCAVAFGIIHFDALAQTAQMVPGWLPGSGRFWAVVTGLGHAAGGVALIVNFRARLAAYSLATMYLIIELLVWVPSAWPIHGDPVVWGGNAITIAIAAAAWVLGDVLAADHRSRRRHSPSLSAASI
jgi:uncharacterized membrane protein